MSSSVSIDISALQGALTKLTSLASLIESERNRVVSGTPCALPSLSDGKVAATAAWLKSQEDELSTRLDLARLLDTKGAGVATYTTDADTLSNTQTMLGQKLADRVNDISYDTDPKDLKTLNEILSHRANDVPVMSAMYQDLQPQGTARAISMLAAGERYTTDDAALTLAKTLRQGLATASKDPYFPSESYGKDMVRWFTAPLLSDDEQEWAEKNNMMGMDGASLLAFMMRDVNYSPDFLKGSANELATFEKEMQDSDFGDATTWYAHNGYSPFNEGKYGDGGMGYADPMAEMMRAMSRQPSTALDFFSDKGNRDFFFDKRDWSDDGYDGVSAAADAASTDPTNLTAHQDTASLIASQFVNQVSDSPGFNPDDAKAASDSVSHILKTYMPSVSTAMDSVGQDYGPATSTMPLTFPGFGSLEHQPVFYRDDLAKMTGVAMSTKDGMTNMAEGVSNFQQTQINALAAQLHDHPDDPGLRKQLESTMENDAELRGFTTHIAGQTQIDDAYNTDQQRRAWTNLLSEGAKAVPIPIPGADFVVGQGIDLGTDAINNAWANTADGVKDDAEAQAYNGVAQMNYETYTSLINAGVIPHDQVDPAFFDQHGDLKGWDQIAGTAQTGSYSEAAAQGLSPYVSDESLQNTYTRTFQDFYNKPGG